MLFDIRKALPLILALGLLTVVFMAGYTVRGHKADAQVAALEAKHAKDKQAQAERHTQAIKEAIALERAVIVKLQEAQDAEIRRREAAEVARRRAVAESRSLHDELQATRTQLADLKNDPSTSPGCRAAAEAGAMCSILLGRCNDRRTELADFADRSASAGQLCVDAYKALTPPGPQGP
jgi:ABC-type protease/lipase transport system fused ATPase/permease subunit